MNSNNVIALLLKNGYVIRNGGKENDWSSILYRHILINNHRNGKVVHVTDLTSPGKSMKTVRYCLINIIQ